MVGLPVITELDEAALRDVAKTAGSALANAGAQAGVDFGKQFGAAATKELDKVNRQWERAYTKVGTAAGRVRVEQAKLNELQEKGVRDGAKFVQQTERLAEARRKEAAAAREAEGALKRLADAQRLASVGAGARAGRGFAQAFRGELLNAIPGARRIASAMGEYETTAGKVGAAAGSAFGMAFTGAATTLLGAAAYTLFRGFQRYQSLDAARNRLESLNKSLERTGKRAFDVGQVMQVVNDVVEGTPFSLEAAFSIASTALSTTTGPSLRRFMTVVADAAGYAGEQIDDIGQAFINVANQGKLSSREINNQFQKLPIKQWLSETMGVPVTEITKMVEANKIGLEDLMKAVEHGASGFAKNSVNTVAGAMEQLHTAVARLGERFLGALFGKPTDDANDLVKVLNNLTSHIDRLGKWVVSHQADIKRFFEQAKDAAKALAGVLETVFGVVSSLPGGIGGVATAFLAWKALTVGQGAINAVAVALSGMNTMLAKTLPASAATGAGKIAAAFRGVALPAIIATTVALDRADQYHQRQQDDFWRRHRQQQTEERLGLRPQPTIPGADGPLATEQLKDAVAAGRIPGYSIGPDGSIIDPAGKRVDFGGNAPAVAPPESPSAPGPPGTILDHQPGASMQEAADAINRAAEEAAEEARGGSSGSAVGEPGGLPFIDPSDAGAGAGGAGGAGGASKATLPYPAEYGRPLRPGETPDQWRADMQRIELEHALAEAQATLQQLEASGADQNDLIRARNDVIDAEMRLREFHQRQREQRLTAPQVPLPAEFGQGPLPGETIEQWRERMDLIKREHDVEQKKANLLALMADNTATQDELIQAQYELNEAQAALMEAAYGRAKDLQGGLDQISAALDDDLGLSEGLPGLAENLVRFVAKLAMAPAIAPLAAMSSPESGWGALGMMAASNIAAGKSPLGLSGPRQPAVTPSAMGPTALQPPTAQAGAAMVIPTGRPRQYEPGMVPNNVRLLSVLEQMFPNLTMSADTGRRDRFGEHGSGEALDIMTNANMALGDQINKWLLLNHKSLGLQYTIWRQATHYPDGRVVAMEDRGSPTQNHMDHVHARVKPGPPASGSVVSAFPSSLYDSAAAPSGVPATGPSLGSGIPIPLPVTIVGGHIGTSPTVGQPGDQATHGTAASGASSAPPVGTPASGVGLGPLPGPAPAAASPGGGGAGTGAVGPGMAPPPSSVISGVQSGGPPGAGGGMQGAIGGLPQAALSTAISAAGLPIDAMAPGAGQIASAAAQTGVQLANRTAGYLGQLAGIGVSGLLETFSFGATNPMADPLKSLPGRVLAGVAGARSAIPNVAGQSQQAVPAEQSAPGGGDQHGQSGGPPGPMVNIENVHQAPGQSPDSVAHSVANQFKSHEISMGFASR